MQLKVLYNTVQKKEKDKKNKNTLQQISNIIDQYNKISRESSMDKMLINVFYS